MNRYRTMDFDGDWSRQLLWNALIPGLRSYVEKEDVVFNNDIVPYLSYEDKTMEVDMNRIIDLAVEDDYAAIINYIKDLAEKVKI